MSRSLQTRFRAAFLALAGLAGAIPGVVPAAGAQCGHQARSGILALGIEAGAVALDRPVHRWLAARPGHPPHGVAGTLSSAGGHLGEAKILIPGLTGAYLIARLTHNRTAARAVLHVAAGYVASDAVTGLLKPVVGRARPSTLDDPFAFHPFSGTDDYHAFPSGHLTHVTSIVAGTLAEAPNPATRVASVFLPAFVGWQRVYTNAHWLSDVTAGWIAGAEGRCLAQAVLGTHW